MLALKRYFSYIRVSTLKQGQTGTSLDEQRAAIENYAVRWNLHIVEEFEEKETAAKQGRPVFNRMLKALVQKKADGVIIHKIDRSARNLKDWADLGELIDQGIEVHFANESLDLHSRGGRLSADIQAVVAADYIRNLREETRKGFYGRLKQGLYPRPAPVGYVDRGKGLPKEVDRVQGPLVKQVFELYATGQWGLNNLVEKMYALGLRGRKNQKVTRNGMSKMLHNPFYLGVVKIKTRDEVYAGQHQAIVPQSLFNRVQEVLKGKHIKIKTRHLMLFRRMLTCAECQAKLIGEVKKGHSYYRCHTKSCAQKCMREEAVEAVLLPVIKDLRFNDKENAIIRRKLKEQYQSVTEFREAQTKSLQLQLEAIRARLSKIVDAYIDHMIDGETYLAKKNMLTMEENAAKRLLENLDANGQAVIKKVEGIIELVNNAYLSYKLAHVEQRREIVEIITSNLLVKDKKLIVKLKEPFQIISEHQKVIDGSPSRDTGRTISTLLSQLIKYFETNDLNDSSLQTNVLHPTLEQRLKSALKISNQPRFLDKSA